MKQEHVNIVVTCTARKTAPVPETLMMRSLRSDRLDRRFSDWDERLQNADAARLRAVDLYCGNSWSVIREIADAEKMPSKLRIWVISAGHGLISIDEFLAPYAATFSSRDDDSVIPPELSSHSVAEWWDKLIRRRRQAGARVASISDIARLHPNEPLIIAISNEYFKAVAHDLVATRSMLADSDLLVIIAAGATKTGTLKANFLPCDSRLEHRYGRSRMALNSRILKSVVQGFEPKLICASHLSTCFQKMLTQLPKAPYPARSRSGDETVRRFIRHEMAGNARSTYTLLLHHYRATGQACEQKRFRRLFREVFGEE